jgi:hypothetical protein
MPRIITNSTQMQCTLGASPVPIVVTSQTFAKIGGGLIATEKDKTPMVNIPTFGVCKCGSPPPPCVPSPTAWQATSTVHTVNGAKSLTDKSFCMCAKGGKISFMNAGANTHVEGK